MAKSRSYKLLCPIARALDRIGDRWTLLILRDLHAGPARYSDLQKGLTGIAANLLAERLAKLVEDGLVRKSETGHGTSVYELTELGQRTSDIIYELAIFGARFQPEGPVIAPGNLRTVATTMGAAANRVATPEMTFEAAVMVDGEHMRLTVNNGHATMRYTESESPDLVFSTSYSDLLAVTEGELDFDTFATRHSKLDVISLGKETEFIALMSRITALLQKE
ncbi:helix-turn-helix domain-containing protein [Ruegeria sp. SCPT10]|uniref:helix-turn-helix domain-containing protein n=1 Tax=Ruegeria sp. SCP10 TaxID=3141377 RepID=UPI003339AB88